MKYEIQGHMQAPQLASWVLCQAPLPHMEPRRGVGTGAGAVFRTNSAGAMFGGVDAGADVGVDAVILLFQ